MPNKAGRKSRFSLLIFTLGLSLLLSACSSQSVTEESSKNFQLVIPPSSSTGCFEEDVDKVLCFFPYEITSLADAPVSLSGKFFALADGKIYLADGSENRVNSVSDTWNPGDKKSGNLFFTLPSNSDINSIFLGPEGTSSVEDAVLIVSIDVSATDPQTQKRKDCESTFNRMNEMLDRWQEASEYPWVVGTPSCYEIEKVYFLASIYAAEGAIYPEGGEVTQCYGSVVAKSQLENLKITAKKYDYALFEDSVSGFIIVTDKNVFDSEYCSYELGKVPALKVLN
jgi:hypothetical protein